MGGGTIHIEDRPLVQDAQPAQHWGTEQEPRDVEHPKLISVEELEPTQPKSTSMGSKEMLATPAVTQPMGEVKSQCQEGMTKGWLTKEAKLRAGDNKILHQGQDDKKVTELK